MSIDDIRPDPVRHVPLSLRERVGGGGTPKIAGVASIGRADRLEISAHARQLARGQNAEEAAKDTLAAERVELVKQRIRDGFYDSPDIVDRVARALLASGDL